MATTRKDVLKVEIDDRPGTLNELFTKVAAAGANLDVIAASPGGPGKSAVFIGSDNQDTLKEVAGLFKLPVAEYAGFTLSGEDAIGAAAEVTKPLADAGVNIEIASALVSDGKYKTVILVDSSNSRRPPGCSERNREMTR